MQANNLCWSWIAEHDFMTEHFMKFLLSGRSFDRLCVGKVRIFPI